MELLERLPANDPQLTELKHVPPSVTCRMHELATALALNTTLTHLRLQNHRLIDANADELAGMLGRNKTLKTLNLIDNSIWFDGARHLAAALEQNGVLEDFWLGWSNIGDDGARDLAAALERNNTLVELSLFRNGIGKVGACHLAAALERNGAAPLRHSIWTATILGPPVPLLFEPLWKPTVPLIVLMVWMELTTF
jgi:hypothetical protein